MKEDGWEKAKRIFADAVKLAPELRLGYLDEVCEGDADTRREVESLLASFDDAGSFLESSAVKKYADVIKGDGVKFGKGERFGHYEIVEQIGAGGMGEVYLALDKKLDRRVAVKILNEKFSQHESNLRRFTQEAKAASALNHPNILVIHEIGESENAKYIVSEFVEGVTLREVLNLERRRDDGARKLAEILDVAVQIAGALTAAHRARIVHRDIKPENIMIRPDGYVKILDFGLAKLVEQKSVGLEDATVEQNQTAKGVILGTVNYMSPEQAKGEPVDARTDVFSLGVVIYEMIAGRTPFAANTMSEAFANLINQEPPPLARFASNVSNELQRVVSKMLRKNKDERYQTAKALLLDLKNLQKRLEFETEFFRGVKASKDGEENVTKIQPSPHPSVSPSALNSIAVLPFANMSADAENEYFCDGLAEELLNALAKIDDLRVAARTSAFSFKGKNAQVSQIGKTLNVNTVLEGSVRKSVNRVRITVQLINAADGYHLWSERYDREMRDIFDVQDEITLAVVDALKVKLFGAEKAAVLKRYTNNPEAYQLFLKGRYFWYKQTPENIRKSRDYFQRAIELDPAYAPGYAGLGEFYGISAATGMMPPDEGWQKAEALLAKARQLDNTIPEVHNGLAAIRMMYYRDWNGAESELKLAVELNPNFAEAHNLHAVYFAAAGQFDDALAEQRRALELDPLSFSYHRYLGNWLYFAGRFDEAIAEYRQAIELDANSPFVYEELGDAYEQKGMNDEAIAAWRKAMTLAGDGELGAILDNASAESGFGGAVRAVARKRLGRLSERRKSGEYVPAIEYARLYTRLGDEGQAFHWLEQAVEERNVFSLWMNSDPFYDRLRGDARFQDLLRRVGFAATEGRTAITKAGGAQTNLLAAATDEKNLAAGDGRAETPERRLKMKRILPIIAALAVLLAGAIGFGYYFWRANGSASGAGGKKSLAVLPFVNASRNPEAEYLSDGITESVINNLSQLSGLKVMSRNSAFRFKDNQTDTRNVAAQLGVETLVTGDIKQIGDKLVINVRLIDGRDDSQIWGNQYVKASGDIIAAQNEIAQAVAQNLRLKLTSAERQQLGKNYTENAEAYELYLRGRFYYYKLTEPEIRKAITLYEQAIGVDPEYALAYAGIADAYRTLPLAGWSISSKEALPRAKAAARRALEIDPNLTDAHVVLGWVGFLYDWDWAAAETEFKRAVELAPNNAEARRGYAHLFSILGRHEEAIAGIRLSRELDPLSLITNALEGQFLSYAGREAEAIARLEKTLELDPNFWVAHNNLGRVYTRQKRYPEAVAALTKAKELSGGSTEPIVQLGYALAKSGNREAAQAALEELKSLAAERFVPAYNFALILGGLGEREEALSRLEKSFQEREVQIAFVKIDTRWDWLRAEPRFVELMRRMNFE